MTTSGGVQRAPDLTDRGAAAVEFALVVTILLVIVFGIINFGVVFSQQLTLNNAVREGARKAVVNEPGTSRTCQGITESVRNETSGLALDSGNIVVTVTADGFTSEEPCDGTPGHVPCLGSYDDATKSTGSLVVEARFNSVILVSFPPFPKAIDLSSKAVYRCEFDS